MHRTAKILLLVYSIFNLVFGVFLFLMPGRFLGWFGWQPVDPLLSRVLGASLLAMAWCSLRGYLAEGPNVIRMLVSGYLVFTALGAIGILRHLVASSYYPFMVWFVFILLAVWAVVWGILLMLLRRANP